MNTNINAIFFIFMKNKNFLFSLGEYI